MGSFSLSGGVEVIGFISPTDPLDEYPVIDPLYGIDGFRNVNLLSDLNNIPELRRRAGMVVGVSGGTEYYKLLPSPWNYTISDWDIFNSGGGNSGSTSTFTGGTVTGDTIFTNGLTATTFSATTYLGLPTDIYVTGGTYSDGVATFTNVTGGTFDVNGFYTGQTSYVNSLTTGTGLSADTTNGNITIINTEPDQVVVLNNGSNINVTGTYPNFTIDVTGLTDNNIYVTGFTYQDNTFTISDNSGSTFESTFNVVTGLTVNGSLSANTYLGLPLDVYITGGTFDKNTETLTLNRGDNNNVQVTGFTDIYTTGFTFNPSTYDISIERNDGVTFTESLSILASDLTVTGGTYNPNSGVATFTNNTGGTFTVSGFITGFTDIYTTGFTYSNNNFTISDTSNNTYSTTINTMTGLTVNGVLSATTIGSSGDCVDDIYVSNIHSCSPLNINPLNEGNVYFGSTSGVTIDLTNNRVGVGTATPVAPIEIYSNQPNVAIPNRIKFSQAGGNIQFEAYAATISDSFGITLSTNWNQRPVRVAGSSGLYVGSTTAVPTPAGYILVEGNVGIGLSGTTAKLHVNNTTSGNTFLAEDSTNPDSSPFVIDASGNTGIGTLTPREKLDVSGNTIITGNLTVSGITETTWFSGNSSSDLVRVTQTGSGNAFVVEDSTNPDSSPFVIDASGNVGIGTNTPLSALEIYGNSTGVTTPLQIRNTFAGGNAIAAIKFTNTSATFPSAQNWAWIGSKRDTIIGKARLVFAASDNVSNNPSTADIGMVLGFDKSLLIGTDGVAGARLDVRASGSASTDIAFRVRNSGDTVNYLVVNGAGDVFNNGAGGVTSNTFYGENVGRSASGDLNTFIGNNAGRDNTTASTNTFIGNSAGRATVNGSSNTFIGRATGLSNTAGGANTFVGASAGQNSNGTSNVFMGFASGLNFTTGDGNIFIGTNSSQLQSNGANLTQASNSIIIGFASRANGNNQINQIVIGHQAIGLGSNTTVIGNTGTTLFRPYGNVAIGKDSASEALDVSGKTKTISLQVTSGATTGYVLTSDASGNATWQVPTITADTYTTGFTYNNNTFTIGRNQGQPNLTATINTVTGLTVNGGLTVTGTSNLNGTITSSNLSGSTDRLVQVNSGGTFSATQEIISAYITSGGTAANQLENVSNWDINGNYTGSTITGTYQGQKHYDGNYFYEAVQDNIFIRLIRG